MLFTSAESWINNIDSHCKDVCALAYEDQIFYSTFITSEQKPLVETRLKFWNTIVQHISQNRWLVTLKFFFKEIDKKQARIM